MENNKQAEITLHNLVVADVSLASFLFGNVLTVTLLMYLVVLPLMYPRFAWVQAFVRALMVPVPKPVHAVITLAMTVRLMDRGTLPCAMCENQLLVTPPGHRKRQAKS